MKLSSLISPIKYGLLILGCMFGIAAFAALPGFDALFESRFFYRGTGVTDAYSIRNMFFSLFRILSVVVFIVAVVIAFIAAIRLLVSDSGEEDFSKWLNTLVWSVAGLLLISMAYGIVTAFSTNVINDATLSATTVYDTIIHIVYPLLNFLRYIAATCFFLALIYAFYRIVISAGDEEGFDTGKKTFIGAATGFIIMLLAEPVVRIVYGGGNCGGSKIFGIATNCTNRVFDTAGSFAIIMKIIVFLNGFVALTTLIMILYAGVLIMTSHGDEEKVGQAKKIITYAVLGIAMILFSYVIYRAFLLFA